MMFQLRILNGLKGGVSFPISRVPISIGSKEEDDILLLDKGFSGAGLSTLINKDNQIEVSFKDGEFYDVNGNSLSKTCIWQPNDVFFHRDICLQFAFDDEPWPEEVPQLEELIERPVPKSSRKVAILIMTSFVCACALLIYNLSYATSSEEVSHLNNAALSSALSESKKSPHSPSPPSPSSGFAFTKQGGGNVTPERDYLQVIDDMIAERELFNLNISKETDHILIEGHLSERDKNVLERMLIRYEFENPLAAKVVNKTEVFGEDFPIEIVSVVSGPYGHIRLADGTRLSKGQDYKGYTLLAIRSDAIDFKGEKTISVQW